MRRRPLPWCRVMIGVTVPSVLRRSVIELLDGEASPDAFYEQLRVAERQCGGPEELERLREEFSIAMRVRSKMAWQRQRESELTALYETANDLTAIRDVDAVLSAIVRRVRQLLGADLGYLSLIDAERGDCYMRITEGSQSPDFPTLRLPLGSGVLGRVVRTATPYFTDNYLADEEIAHLEHVDKAAVDEGIRAVLGVPLILNGEVIGALLAANRSPRRFSHDEVALLSSLAAHAAIALENARLFEETRSALRELNEASAEVRAHSESLERAASAHDRLAEVLLQGGRVTDVARVLADVLLGAVWVLDPAGHVLAVAGVGAPEPGVALDEAVATALASGRTADLVAPSGESLCVAVARAGAEHLGTVVLGGTAPAGETDRRILERAAVVTAVLLMFQRSVAEAEDRVRGELLDDLLSIPQRDPDTLRERARRYRADLDAAHVVIVARVEGVERHRGAAAAAPLATERHGLAGVRGEDVVLVVPGEDPLPCARRIADRLRGALGRRITAGVAGPAAGPARIARAYREAHQCLAALLALGRCGDVADAAALGFARFLLGSGGNAEVEEYLRRTLGPVLDYDERRGTQLTATLEAWFAGGSLGAASERLHVHANTVGQRLDRVAALLGEDWRQPERALDIQLALQVWRLRERGVQPASDGGT